VLAAPLAVPPFGFATARCCATQWSNAPTSRRCCASSFITFLLSARRATAGAQLARVYRAELAAQAADLPPLPAGYADYAARQRCGGTSASTAEHPMYWRKGTHRIRTAGSGHARAILARVGQQRRYDRLHVLRRPDHRVHRAGLAPACTPPSPTASCFQTPLAAYTGQDDNTIGRRSSSTWVEH
jgi:hypothetical protein